MDKKLISFHCLILALPLIGALAFAAIIMMSAKQHPSFTTSHKTDQASIDSEVSDDLKTGKFINFGPEDQPIHLNDDFLSRIR